MVGSTALMIWSTQIIWSALLLWLYGRLYCSDYMVGSDYALALALLLWFYGRLIVKVHLQVLLSNSKHVHRRTHTRTHAYAHTHSHTLTHTYIHTHTHVRTHARTCMHSFAHHTYWTQALDSGLGTDEFTRFEKAAALFLSDSKYKCVLGCCALWMQMFLIWFRQR